MMMMSPVAHTRWMLLGIVALVVVIAFAASPPRAASGQQMTTIFSGTLTVGELTADGHSLGLGYNSLIGFGSLSPSSFTYMGTNYPVDTMESMSSIDSITLSLHAVNANTALGPATLTLTREGTTHTYTLSSAVFIDRAGSSTWTWTGGLPSWSSGETWTVTLSVPPPPPTATPTITPTPTATPTATPIPPAYRWGC